MFPKRFIIQVVLFSWLLLSALHSAKAGSIIPDDYDDIFSSMVVILPKEIDWRLLKAQCWQESRFNPYAVSPVGAEGLCQFMPGTQRYVAKKYKFLNGSDFFDPYVSIFAAALYMRILYDAWKEDRDPMDRWKLALASYNAGIGNIIKAQRLSGGARDYETIVSHLHKVTGRHSRETIEYVELITGKWYESIILQ